MTDPATITSSVVTKHGLVALFGAIVHASRAHRTGKSRGFGDFAILIVMSSFSGLMFGLTALHFFPNDQYLSLVITGTGGFLGVEGMTLIVNKVQQLIAGDVRK